MHPILRIVGEIVVSVVAGTTVFLLADGIFIRTSGDIHNELLLGIAAVLGLAAIVAAAVVWQKLATRKQSRPPISS